MKYLGKTKWPRLVSPFLIFSLAFFIGCKKETPSKPSAPVEIVLNPAVFKGENIFLEWTPINKSSFSFYTVYRLFNNDDTLGTPIGQWSKKDSVSFTDRLYPFNKTVGYRVVATLQSSKNSQIISNRVYLDVPKPTLVLNPLVFKNDSVVLSWKVSNKRYFKNFYIGRYTSPTDIGTQIGYTSSGQIFSFTDKTVPFISYVRYSVMGYQPDYGSVYGNEQLLERPEITTLNMVEPLYSLFDKERETLFLLDRNGDIISYNLITNKTIHIKTNRIIGYPGLAKHNGKMELYVPRQDGWLYIYDSETLQKTDEIFVDGTLYSVVKSGKFLYVSRGPFGSTSLLVYDRDTKNLVSAIPNGVNKRLLAFENSNTVIVGIGDGSSFLIRYLYDNGRFISSRTENLMPLTTDPTTVITGTDKFVTSNAGAIINSNLEVLRFLPAGFAKLTSFAVRSEDEIIYATTSGSTVEAYSLANNQWLHNYKTRLYPLFVFDYNNRLLVVSRFSPSGAYTSIYQPNNTVLEILDK